VTDAITAILHERGRETKMKMSEFLLKAARQLAEREDIVVDSPESAKILEALRSSLYPQPAVRSQKREREPLRRAVRGSTSANRAAMTKLM
jgi:uncharacterized protein YyaL (SSP411 family)